MYDSPHAAEGVLGSGSKEEYCIKDPQRIVQLRQVIICNTGNAKVAGFTVVKDPAVPPGEAWLLVEWEWEDGEPHSGRWRPYAPDAIAALSAACATGEYIVHPLQLQLGGNEYTIDFAASTQTRTGTGSVRAVWRNMGARSGGPRLAEDRLVLPDGFECPIMQELMADPVQTADGQSY